MEHEFQCNQTCIDAILIRCDTKTDCLNGTDEHGCGKLNVFLDYFGKCSVKILLKWIGKCISILIFIYN